MMAAEQETHAPEIPFVREIRADESTGFLGLTAPALRTALMEPYLPEGCFRIGAFLGNQPAGLLLSAPQPDDLQDITSIMVAPRFRRRGIGRALLADIAHRARALGRNGLVARWSDRLPQAAAFSALLASQGWSDPIETRRRMTWRVGDWTKGFPRRDAILARLRANGLMDRSLAALDVAEIEDLKRQNAELIANGRAPDWSSAEGWLPLADPDATVLLYDTHGRLHGWMAVNYQAKFDRWFIPQGYVVAEKVSAGWLIGAIASLWMRLEAKAGPDALLIAQPPAGAGGAMERMLFRHFGAHAVATDFLRESVLVFRRDDG